MARKVEARERAHDVQPLRSSMQATHRTLPWGNAAMVAAAHVGTSIESHCSPSSITPFPQVGSGPASTQLVPDPTGPPSGPVTVTVFDELVLPNASGQCCFSRSQD